MSFAATAVVAGSAISAYGASKKASAEAKAAKQGQQAAQKLTAEQVARSREVAAEQQTYLQEGDPFADMGKFIFGDASAGTYSNLRKTQSDFAKLAAGDTTGFQKEVASIVSNSLSSTFGGPRGSFENLSAKNLLNFRQLGANTAMSLTDYFGKTGQQLISSKFGILDQTFDRQMKLREYETNAVNQFRMQAAGAEGVGMAGIGNVFNAVGGGFSSMAAIQSNEKALASQEEYQKNYLSYLFNSIGKEMPSSMGGGVSKGGTMPASIRGSGPGGGGAPYGDDSGGNQLPVRFGYENFMAQPFSKWTAPQTASSLYVNPKQPLSSTAWDFYNQFNTPSNKWGGEFWSTEPHSVLPPPSY